MLAKGTRLDRYEILGILGVGGMGEVYRAHDHLLDREVAIKVLPDALSDDPDARRRLEREGRKASRLNHPHICRIYDLVRHGEMWFLVMELVEGTPLSEEISKGPIRPRRAIELAIETAEGLHAAHTEGLIHRDLKPANILITSSGVRIIDFGLARSADQQRTPGADATTLTKSSDSLEIAGTLPYMSPEQLSGERIDGRSDIWSLGVVTFEMLTGARPFQADSRARLVAEILGSDPPDFERQDVVQPSIAAALRRCLEKDPARRWQSAADLASHLRTLSSEHLEKPTPATGRRTGQPKTIVTAAGAGILLAVLAVALGLGREANEIEPVQSLPGAAAVVQPATQLTFEGTVSRVAISPEGRTLAYVVDSGSSSRIFVKDISSGGQPLQVWSGGHVPRVQWSHDGSSLFFSEILPRSPLTRRFGVRTIGRYGGPDRGLEIAYPLFSMSPDETRAVGATENMNSIAVIDVETGEQTSIPIPGMEWTIEIQWAPAGDIVASVTIDGDENWHLNTVDVSTGEVSQIDNSTPPVAGICWAPTGRVLYAMQETPAGVNLNRYEVSKGSVSTRRVRAGLSSAESPCSITADGTLMAYVRDDANANLVSLQGPEWRRQLLTTGTFVYEAPSIAESDRTIFATRSTNEESWIVRIDEGSDQPVPIARGLSSTPSPDGQRLAILVPEQNRLDVWISDPAGLNRRRLVLGPIGHPAVSWVDTHRLAIPRDDQRNYDIVNIETGEVEDTLLEQPKGWVFFPIFSPDQKRVAVWWNRSEEGLWILDWPSRSEKLLSRNHVPIGWSSDGEWVYARVEGAGLMDSSEIAKIHAGSGEIEVITSLDDPSERFTGCTVGPGEEIICSLEHTRSDAWLIELQPPEQVKAASTTW